MTSTPIRLSKAFDTTPESWLTLQMQYYLWQAEQKRKELKVVKVDNSTF